jgi:hypothetical protein
VNTWCVRLMTHFSINCSCKLNVKAGEVDRDSVCIFERPEFVTLCYDCEHVASVLKRAVSI